MSWWPWTLIRKHDLRMVMLENQTLRTDLGNAMIELRKHRLLIAGLRTGEPEITKAMERARS